MQISLNIRMTGIAPALGGAALWYGYAYSTFGELSAMPALLLVLSFVPAIFVSAIQLVDGSAHRQLEIDGVMASILIREGKIWNALGTMTEFASPVVAVTLLHTLLSPGPATWGSGLLSIMAPVAVAAYTLYFLVCPPSYELVEELNEALDRNQSSAQESTEK